MRCTGIAALLILIGLPEVVRADEPVPVTRLTRTHFTKFFLRYSPDGSHLAYSRHYANRRAANRVLVGLHLVKADGSEDRRVLTEFDREVQIQEHPAWSPNGKQLVISGGGNDTGNSSKDVYVCNIDATGNPVDLRKIIPGTSVGIGEEPCWSPDGQRLCAVSITERMFVVDADGKNLTQILQVDGSYCHQPDWSPDGEWIAFSTDRDGNVEIYKIRADGTELTRLTHTPGIDAHPRWSPDGRWLSFTSNRDGNYDIHVMSAGGAAVRPITQHPATDDHPAWSPDGKSIAFVSMRDGGFDLYRADVPVELAVKDKPPAVPRFPSAATGDLVLHYSFDGVTEESRTVPDRAGRHALDLQGATLVTLPNKMSGALAFDGQAAFASAGNALDLQLSGPFTLSLWVKPDSAASNGYIVSKQGWNIYLGADLIPRFETRSAEDTAWNTLAAKQAVPLGAWTFIAAVFDPKSQHQRLYLNGQLSAEVPRTDGSIGAIKGYPLVIGHYVASKTQAFQGQIDEVRLDRRALSEAQLLKEYETQRPLVLGE